MNLAQSNETTALSGTAAPIKIEFAISPAVPIPIQHRVMKTPVAHESQIHPAFFHTNELPSTRVQARAPLSISPFVPGTTDDKELVLQAAGNERKTSFLSRNDIARSTTTQSASSGDILPRKTSGTSSGKLKQIEFHLEAPAAHSVKLAADFTDWEKYPVDMIRSGNGVWFTQVPLLPGNYSYRFIVDGQWRDDPRPAQRVPNPFGTVNAVMNVT